VVKGDAGWRLRRGKGPGARRRFGVPTFDQVIELAQTLTRELRRPIGVYPETKHPTHFRNTAGGTLGIGSWKFLGGWELWDWELIPTLV
jgi:glycerophosphoryl diester phosphodiesterase